MTTRTIRPIIASPPPAGPLESAVTVAGAIIRYAFYLIFIITMGAVFLTAYFMNRAIDRQVPKRAVDEAPAFRVAASLLEGKKVVNLVETAYGGRAEVRQYGQLYERDFDFTIMLALPGPGEPVWRNFDHEISRLPPLRGGRTSSTQNFHDLETRFGSVRAADFTINADGRRKLCLAYLSRFDSAAVFIKGWYCEANGNKPSPDRLACILDKLTLDAPLAAKEADAFLRQRIARGASCSATPVSQTYDNSTRRISPPSRWSQPSATYRN